MRRHRSLLLLIALVILGASVAILISWNRSAVDQPSGDTSALTVPTAQPLAPTLQGRLLIPIKTPAPFPRIPAQNDYGIRGHCISPGGDDVVQVTVEAIVHDPDTRTAQVVATASTDGSGNFEVNLQPYAGQRLILRLRHAEYAPRNVIVPAHFLSDGGDLGAVVLPRGVRVRGAVRDERGALLPAARVEWHLHSSLSGSGGAASDPAVSVFGSAQTEDDGAFDIGSLSPGSLELLVRPAGSSRWFEAGRYLVPMDTSIVELAVTLSLDRAKTVRVQTPKGAPIPGATFRALDTLWTVRNDLLETTGPDGMGIYELHVTADFGGRVIVSAQGFRSGLTVVSQEMNDLGTIALEPGSDRVKLILQGAQEGATVFYGVVGRGAKRSRFPALRRANVEADLTLSAGPPIDGVAAGMAIIVVDHFDESGRCWMSRDITAEDYSPGSAPITVAPQQLDDRQIVCVKELGAGVVSGAAVVLVRALEGAGTYESSWGKEMATGSGFVPSDEVLCRGTTDAAGTAHLYAVPGFRFLVSASAPGYATSTARLSEDRPMAVPLSPEGRVLVDMPQALDPTIAGPILIQTEGRRILRPNSSDAKSASFYGLSAGRYVLGYELIGRFATYLPEVDIDRLRAISGTEIIEMRGAGLEAHVALPSVGAPSWISGRVIGTSGERRATIADVVPSGAGTASAPIAPVGVDSSGRFELGPLLGGDYIVRLFADPSGPMITQEMRLPPGVHADVEIDGK